MASRPSLIGLLPALLSLFVLAPVATAEGNPLPAGLDLEASLISTSGESSLVSLRLAPKIKREIPTNDFSLGPIVEARGGGPGGWAPDGPPALSSRLRDLPRARAATRPYC
jgi:hypothetical protein